MTPGLKLFSGVLSLILCLSLAAPVYSQDQGNSLAVIVSAGNSSIQSISVKQLRKFYLGKSLKMSDGSRALLVNYKPSQTVFNKVAIGRSDAQVQSVWARLKFSGRSKEPKLFSAAEALIKFVSENPNAIGYIPASELTPEVRAVLTLDH